MIMKKEPRRAAVSRRTAETDIALTLDLDGTGVGRVDTPVPFLNHMLTLWAKHGLVDLELTASGDVEVDGHHTVEDIGIALGQALNRALGDKGGIARYGSILLPMDEALALVAVDLSGRGYLAWDVTLPSPRVGDFDTELVEEFCRALAHNGAFTLHVCTLAGRNTHHIIEAIFKALGRALRQAVGYDPRESGIPSTKGQL